MRKVSILMSMILMLALLLTACGGEETTTSVPSTNVPPITAESTSTEDMSGTQTPATGDLTTTPSVPVTGENNPSRVTNLMDFIVTNQSGEQVGDVEDFVLDLDNTTIAYVVVGTGGFMDLGDKEVLIPWEQLQLPASAVSGGQNNSFVLLADADFLKNAPDVDVNTMLPQMGQPASDWDADIRSFWQTGQAPGGSTTTGTQTSNTPSGSTGSGTASPLMTATTSGAGAVSTATGSGTTAGSGTSTGSGTGTSAGQGSGEKLQGVMLASEVIGSTIKIGNGEGQAQGQATMAATAMPAATSSTGTDTTATPATGTSTQSTGNTGSGAAMSSDEATIEDMIVDPMTGDIQYLVLKTKFDDGERWIPVPLSTLRWDATTNGFLFVANANALQNAPFFQEEQFPDTTTTGWDSDFSTFWQNNGGTGGSGTGSTGTSGTVTSATATATP